jgi:hypothetical protein
LHFLAQFAAQVARGVEGNDAGGMKVTKSEAPSAPAIPRLAKRAKNGREDVFFMIPAFSVLADTTNLNEKVMNVPSAKVLILKNYLRKRSLHGQYGRSGFGLCFSCFHEHGHATLSRLFQHQVRLLH